MTTTRPTLLVAGGGGFIGRYVCDAARRAGFVVTTLGRGADNDIVRDLLDPSAATRHGFDYLINLAAYSDHAATRGLDWETVVDDSAQMMRAVSGYGPFRRAIHISTSEVFGDRRHIGWAQVGDPYRIESTYAAGKAEQERWAQSYGWHVVRITNIWGDGQPAVKAFPRICEAVVRGEVLADHTGGVPVQWSWVRDVSRRLVEALAAPAIRDHEHLAPAEAETFAGFVEMVAANLWKPAPDVEPGIPLAPVLGIVPTLALDGVNA